MDRTELKEYKLFLAGWGKEPKKRFVKKNRGGGVKVRKSLWRRDCGWVVDGVEMAHCRYCEGEFRLADLTIDHVVPLAKGGADNKSNKVLACSPCNLKKGSKDGIFPKYWIEGLKLKEGE